jgi:hypothetical protein
MANEVTVPIDDLKRQLAEISGGEADDESKAVAGSSGFVKRISIKGGVFRKFAAGKEVAAVTDRFMHVIFAKMSPTPSRMFYPDAYVEGQKVAPLCWSTNSEIPDPDVAEKQASNCRECKNSIKGSGRDGQGQACRLSWRTAVVLPNDPSGDVMQLVIPAASVWGQEYNRTWPFQQYVRFLVENNISVGRVITKMEFDLRKPSPTLLFSPIAPVPAEMIPVIAEQNKSLVAQLATKLTVFKGRVVDEEAEHDDSPASPIKVDVPSDSGDVPEPILREAAKPTPPAEKAELSETIKKWATKKVS